MKNKPYIYIIISFALVCFLNSSALSCKEVPNTPEETPAHKVSANMSEEEVCAYVWSKLPSELPNDYEISQFTKESRMARYDGNGKWIFSVSGTVEDTKDLPSEIVEKVTDYWVERKACETTTCKLNLTAVFYEDTKTVEIEDVLDIKGETKTEVEESPIKKELEVQWDKVMYGGRSHFLEISFINSGRVPLKHLTVKVKLINEEGEILTTEQANVEPDIIEPGEYGQVYHTFLLKEFGKNYYAYQFFTASGEGFNKPPFRCR